MRRWLHSASHGRNESSGAMELNISLFSHQLRSYFQPLFILYFCRLVSLSHEGSYELSLSAAQTSIFWLLLIQRAVCRNYAVFSEMPSALCWRGLTLPNNLFPLDPALPSSFVSLNSAAVHVLKPANCPSLMGTVPRPVRGTRGHPRHLESGGMACVVLS